MAVFRVEKTRDYTVMANHHLKNRALTLKAKGLLSLMLSLPEDWDYTLKGLSLISVEGIDAIREAVRELECAGYIIRSRERNGKGQLKGTEYVIYEKPHSSEAPPGGENPAQENPTLDNPTQEKPMLGSPALAEPIQENPTQLNTKGLKTYPENTQTVNPHGANPYPSNPNPSYRATGSENSAGWDEMGYDEASRYREMVLENLEYDLLVQDRKTNRERLDEIVDLIVETLCSTKPTICVSGDDYPASLVKEKLLRLTSTHMDYVFECLDKNTTYVRNIKKYLLATLFNAPSTIDSYYSALVNHDLYGDGSRGR
ncbi:helix-turn-helix domain-containing protein [Oscillospiraceae bacterium CM]|nr:helix-turn-helix domain-containing protein [Oscillospiraceae bacterium CM]